MVTQKLLCHHKKQAAVSQNEGRTQCMAVSQLRTQPPTCTDDESSHLAFSDASLTLCRAMLSFVRSTPIYTTKQGLTGSQLPHSSQRAFLHGSSLLIEDVCPNTPDTRTSAELSHFEQVYLALENHQPARSALRVTTQQVTP